jgi:DNA-binding CsgD family transcriptional regulator
MPTDEFLTDEELKMLSLFSEGTTAVRVAEIMCYSRETVNRRMLHVKAVLETRNRTHSVAEAIRRGYIE